MAEVTLRIHGKTYVVGCEDGAEDHLRILAAMIDEKVLEAAPTGSEGSPSLGETRLMLLGALLLADALVEAKAAIAAKEAEVARLQEEMGRLEAEALAALDLATSRVEALAAGRAAPPAS